MLLTPTQSTPFSSYFFLTNTTFYPTPPKYHLPSSTLEIPLFTTYPPNANFFLQPSRCSTFFPLLTTSSSYPYAPFSPLSSQNEGMGNIIDYKERSDVVSTFLQYTQLCQEYKFINFFLFVLVCRVSNCPITSIPTWRYIPYPYNTIIFSMYENNIISQRKEDV